MQQQIDHFGLYLQAAGVTDVGRKRALNEDCFYIDEALRLLLVADGMGGHTTGEVASREAIEMIRNYLHDHHKTTATVYPEPEDNDATIKDLPVIEATEDSEPDEDRTLEYMPNSAVPVIAAALDYANQHLHTLNQQRGFPENQGMGTTIAGLWLPEPFSHQAIVFHIGDSRIYVYRERQLQQLTRDHTLYQYWKDHGQIGPSPARNIIFRSLGPTAQVGADIQLQLLKPHDLILVCSDGLSGMVPDAWIEAALHQLEPNHLQAKCEELVALANAQGGVDNITLILACCGRAPA